MRVTPPSRRRRGGPLQAWYYRLTMMRFEAFCSEIANRETRRVILPDSAIENGRLILPANEYLFDEWYCEEANCDCRRVMFNVLSLNPKAHLATINHAFDPPTGEYKLLGQTFLDPLNGQSKWSEALLDLFKTVLLADAPYVARLQRHYHLFKLALTDPTNPGNRLLAKLTQDKSTTDVGQAGEPRSKRRIPIPPPPLRGKRKWR